MCKGSSAPGSRTTFRGKSGMRSGRMFLIHDSRWRYRVLGRQNVLYEYFSRREIVTREFFPEPLESRTRNDQSLAQIGQERFHFGTGVIVTLLDRRGNSIG